MKNKSFLYIIIFSVIAGITISSCNKVDYPNGLPQYDNYYYLGFLPWNNTKVTVSRTQTALLKFPVQFHSAFVRSYDAIAHYKADTAGIASPAILGQDFNIVDKDGNTLQELGDSVFTMKFPQAKAAYDTIYVKLLNSSMPGSRTINIDISLNQTPEYTVGIFSQAYRRPVQIN